MWPQRNKNAFFFWKPLNLIPDSVTVVFTFPFIFVTLVTNQKRVYSVEIGKVRSFWNEFLWYPFSLNEFSRYQHNKHVYDWSRSLDMLRGACGESCSLYGDNNTVRTFRIKGIKAVVMGNVSALFCCPQASVMKGRRRKR